MDMGQINASLGDIEQHIEMCQWDKAISLLRRAVEERPFDCRAISKLGFALWKKGERQEGAETLERALQLDPDDGEVIKDCVQIFLEAGRDVDARQIFESYVQRNPWDWEIKDTIEALLKGKPENAPIRQSNDNGASMADMLVSLGEEEFSKGQTERARMCFEIALEKNPGSARAYNNMGVLAWQSGDLEGALTCFDKALDLAPADGEILLNAARVLGAHGQCETAAQLLEIYLTAHPQEADAWNEYRDLIRKSAQCWSPDNLDSTVAQVYVEMGRRLAEAGDIQGAAEAFARAARIEPNDVAPYYHLALLHLQLDQFHEALDLLQQAHSLDDQNADVAEALAQVRKKLDAASEDIQESPLT